MNTIDNMVRAVARAVLVDVELHQYCRVKLIAGLYAVCFEIEEKALSEEVNNDAFDRCLKIYQTIVK